MRIKNDPAESIAFYRIFLILSGCSAAAVFSRKIRGIAVPVGNGMGD